VELKPHTDATYLTDTPALQFFNCIEQRATGGDTWLVDGFSIAEKIREEHPEVFEFFSTRTIPFFHKSKSDGVHMVAYGKGVCARVYVCMCVYIHISTRVCACLFFLCSLRVDICAVCQFLPERSSVL
jgi:hypothetical protein